MKYIRLTDKEYLCHGDEVIVQYSVRDGKQYEAIDRLGELEDKLENGTLVEKDGD